MCNLYRYGLESGELAALGQYNAKCHSTSVWTLSCHPLIGRKSITTYPVGYLTAFLRPVICQTGRI